jgi:cell division protein FtsI (penicillin-binding protein 3)
MKEPTFRWRFTALTVFLVLCVLVLIYRLVDLGVFERPFLLRQSQARILRTVSIPAYRGMISDRNGMPLAISTSVKTVWANPHIFKATPAQLRALSKLLKLPASFIKKRTRMRSGLEFVYVKRRISPQLAARVEKLKIKGLFFQQEYKRFYPEGAVTAHVVGFTNIDDKGQEGLELAYNNWLSGSPGKKKVLKDRLGHVIANVALLKKPKQGHPLTLSIDQRIQFLAYLTLQKTVEKFHAKSGSIVVMNPKTGEILAMVNQPSFNPNMRPKDTDGRYRNRAVTDIFEPGSTIKAFNVALALESGKYTPKTIINTSPGWMRVGGYTIRDDGLDYGKITLTQLLQKSSNIGAAKVMLSLKPQDYYDMLRRVGFGERSRSGFPGESTGTLEDRTVWRPSVVAGLAYGYGIAVTALQLAHAYCVLGDGGVKMPATFIKRVKPLAGTREMPKKIADTVVHMLESVLQRGGTGTRARVAGYRVSGKTGTAYVAGPKGYYKNRYVSSFVGLAPASDPQLVVAVVVFEPHGEHFGALVAAPAFAKVMGGSLRLLNIAPDAKD